MTWVIGIVLILFVLRFIIGGLRTRCPKCSNRRVHRKTINGIKCLDCSHEYSKREAVEWQDIAFKLGDKESVEEYLKIKGIDKKSL